MGEWEVGASNTKLKRLLCPVQKGKEEKEREKRERRERERADIC